MTATMSAAGRTSVFLWITAASLLGFAATDLVLPAVPGLPQALHGTPAQAQFMLAAFVAGFAAGLLLWGELGARQPLRVLLAARLRDLVGFGRALAVGRASPYESARWRVRPSQATAIATAPETHRTLAP